MNLPPQSISSRLSVATLLPVTLCLCASSPPSLDASEQAHATQDQKAPEKAVKKRRKARSTPKGAAIEWLLAHQDADGKWDCDEFHKHDDEASEGPGSGDPGHDVGVTALAVLALLKNEAAALGDELQEPIERATAWLVSQQAGSTGLIGSQVSYSHLYDHAIATLALCTVIESSEIDTLTDAAQKAVDCIESARNEDAGWRYAMKPDGQTDMSMTAWMIGALTQAKKIDLKVDDAALVTVGGWIDSVTDARSGRIGYTERGSTSSRVAGVNQDYTTVGAEALTAAGLVTRHRLGVLRAKQEVTVKGIELLVKALPKWSDDGSTNDMYYWYYGTEASLLMDSKSARRWKKAMKAVLRKSRIKKGDHMGSTHPNGPWGYSGGRVYSTSMVLLCLGAIDPKGR